MKQKFQLWSKIIGLFVISSSVVTVIFLVGMLFLGQPDYNEITDSLSYNNPQLQALLKSSLRYERQYFTAIIDFEKKFLIQFAIISLLPIPFGLYLMRSNNFFVRLAFPEKKSLEETIIESREQKDFLEKVAYQPAPPKDDDSRWKPPNY